MGNTIVKLERGLVGTWHLTRDWSYLLTFRIDFIFVAQSCYFYQRNHSIVHGGERDTPFEAAVSSRTVVTFVTWLISRTEFSSSELVLCQHFLCTSFLERKGSRLFVKYKHVCTKWSFAVSSMCLAHHAVRLWCSPRLWPHGATNPVEINWNCATFPSLIPGKMAVLDKTESIDPWTSPLKGLHREDLHVHHVEKPRLSHRKVTIKSKSSCMYISSKYSEFILTQSLCLFLLCPAPTALFLWIDIVSHP